MNTLQRDQALEDLRRLSTELTEAFATAGDAAYSVDVPGGPTACGADMREVTGQLLASLQIVVTVIRRVEEQEDESDE
ncbi:hypothetical protein QFW96_20935 [Saccharopolyspora sp. TS4A08]|uniref:Uncharacterized protein n=1 Tax=Saccharopolyspora ipomoeae TaxID=3042027 RepID=A0ABT6PTD3_9PSEU|nr:hypothetical protein [Saccharopolyspora sp. TS4A08]MDI2031110.1 hypothetical protein [Saccharopolyspora sp. TS4A08]